MSFNFGAVVRPRYPERIRNIAWYSQVESRPPDHTRREYATAMATLVTRNQFNVTPQGVVHKPTEAAFIPSPGDPLSGTMRLGQLVNQQPNGREYRAEDVQRIMRELWEEFVASNSEMFNTNSAPC